MSPSLLCLTFMQMMGTTHAHIPEHVDSMVKAKIIHQFKIRYPTSEILFDRDNCPNKGQYWYSANGFVLEANHEFWNGRLENSVSDILDGQKIPFAQNVQGKISDSGNPSAMEAVLAEHAIHQEEQKISDKDSSRRWAAWALAGVAAATGGYILYKNLNSSGKESTVEPESIPPPPSRIKKPILDRASPL